MIITAAFGVCNFIVLNCSYAMVYDLRKVTELHLGDDKVAVILGWFSLVIGVSGSLAAVTLGTVLQASGFDPLAAPSSAVITSIIALQTWVPALIVVASAVVLLFWNINAKSHSAVTAAIDLRTVANATAAAKVEKAPR
ncbi:MFS transporter [Rathayibacter sp. VKM Ac-2760]|uniref:MFS transporter n=1 Tax=Rathayibacter sp. VKM Ac-2760 TaxID=2609253 RepID=UPI00131891A0|nr:MFS transporter [Rathayibacter sp. VKM Ac-2760]QHC61188.1 hypothetical protein GSU72_20920 [Rathayibacter sp. VKM Ac-2760]